MSRFSLSVLASLMLLLASCGGGGDGGDENTAPSAQTGLSASVDGQYSYDYLAGTDADGDTLSYVISTNPAHGSVSLSGNTATYTPAADYNGSDSFSFTVSDGTAISASASVALTVNPVNDAPALTSASTVSVAENQTAVQTVTATDADGDSLTFSLSGGADQVLFAIDGSSGALTFQSAPDYETPADADANNAYVVEVSVSDGSLSASQTMTVTVTNVNDNTPVRTSASTVSVAENQTAVQTVTATDADGDSLTFSLSGGADQVLFAIDGSSGALTFQSAPITRPRLMPMRTTLRGRGDGVRW